jgi:uncharacterized protein (UPF0332 family)
MELSAQKLEIKLYMERAQQMLEVAARNLDDGFYDSSVNRSYYAVFYAANALLITKGLAMKRHSGVISAFRQYFVKPGLLETFYSELYGRLLNHREISDYELLVTIEAEQAAHDFRDAKRLVERAAAWLREEDWL